MDEFTYRPPNHTVPNLECTRLDSMKLDLQSAANQVVNYAVHIISNTQSGLIVPNLTLRDQLNKLMADAAQARGQNDLLYFKAISEMSNYLKAQSSVNVINYMEYFNTLWQDYSSLYSRCSDRFKYEELPEPTIKRQDTSQPKQKLEKCSNNPAKWGVRFIYKEYPNCGPAAHDNSLLSSSNTDPDLFDTFKGLLPKDGITQPITEASLLTDNQLQTRVSNQQSRPRPTAIPNRMFTPTTDNQLQTSVQIPLDIGAALTEAITDTSDIKGALLNMDVPVKEWYLTLLPAIQTVLPKQGTRDVPNSMPGVQFRAANRIVKHHVPGMNPIYQNLGVDSLFITFVGTFTGDGGLNTVLPQNLFDSFARPMAPPEVAAQANQKAATTNSTSALTRYSLYGGDTSLFQQDGCPGQCPPPGTRGPYSIETDFIDAEWKDVISPEGRKNLGDVAGELDAYKEFTSFYKMAYSEGRHLEIEINMRRNRDGLVVAGNPLDPNYKDPLRGEGGNPKFKGYIRRLESYLQYSDRVWYLIEVEVTDHGDVTNMPLNLTNVIGQEEAPQIEDTRKAGGTDEQDKLVECLIGKGLLPGSNNKLNMGGGKTLYIFNNGQGAIVKGDLKKENVESIVPPQEALIKGLSYSLAGEEANLYKEFINRVNLTPLTPAPEHLLSSATLTTEAYNKGGWVTYQSFDAGRDNTFNYLYLHKSGYGFMGPSPDTIQGVLVNYPNIRIHSPSFVMGSIIPNLPDDARWKAMREYVQNSNVESKDSCDLVKGNGPVEARIREAQIDSIVHQNEQPKLMVDDPRLGRGGL